MLSLVKGPYLQWPTADAMTIMWETSEPGSSEVEVFAAERIHSGFHGNFKAPEHRISFAAIDGNATIHQVTVTGLEPGKYYFYQATSRNENGQVQSDRHPFKTAVPAGTPFSFAVTSETGGYSCFDRTDGRINANLFEQMKRYRPDLALFIGDIVDEGSRYEDWEKYFFAPGKDFLANTPSYSCLGNHENGGEWFYRFFAFAPPKNYYSFDYGDVHFVCLDSTDFIPAESYPVSSEEIGPGNAQYDFLVRDLESSPAKWKVVFFHYPPYVSGGYQVEELRKLGPVLERYGVDVVFNSHTIVYERSHPLTADEVDYDNGIVYVVAGGAGAMPEWLLPKREWHTSQSVAVPHFLQVVASPSRLELRALDEHGGLFDRFCIAKDPQGKKTFL